MLLPRFLLLLRLCRLSRPFVCAAVCLLGAAATAGLGISSGRVFAASITTCMTSKTALLSINRSHAHVALTWCWPPGPDLLSTFSSKTSLREIE